MSRGGSYFVEHSIVSTSQESIITHLISSIILLIIRKCSMHTMNCRQSSLMFVWVLIEKSKNQKSARVLLTLLWMWKVHCIYLCSFLYADLETCLLHWLWLQFAAWCRLVADGSKGPAVRGNKFAGDNCRTWLPSFVNWQQNWRWNFGCKRQDQ